MLHVLAFLLSLAIDYLWAKCVLATGNRNAYGAALLSGVLFVLGFYSYKLCLTGDEYIIPTAMGHALGAGVGVVRWRQKQGA